MRDFTLEIFRELLITILDSDYNIIPVKDFSSANHHEKKMIICRHDVDSKPFNALKMAVLESELGMKATYYFRIVQQSYDEGIIEQIVDLGHEIGYHYEDLSLAKGDFERAIKLFEQNLAKLKQLYPVATICMHGSPLSKWDNGLLWKRYDYRDFGINGEPYFDIDFNKVLYLTDTGRRWNKYNVNIRDKVKTKFTFNFKTTEDIIMALQDGGLPDQIMINVHPQRWTDNNLSWFKELIWQNIKNPVKGLLNESLNNRSRS